MAAVEMIEEEAATGKVKEIYNDIKESLSIDFVPNMYKAMARNPSHLEASWKKIRAVMAEQHKLDDLTKDIIALTVSTMNGCRYCIEVYTSAVRNGGLDDDGITEAAAVIDVFNGLNKFNTGLDVEMDEKPWYGCGGTGA
jgi:AhpD family alkylhydroperoxidase